MPPIDHHSTRSISPERAETSVNLPDQADGIISPASSFRGRSMDTSRDNAMAVTEEYEYVGWCSECETIQDPPYLSGCSVSVQGENITALRTDPKLLPCNFTVEYSENTTWSTYVRLGTLGGKGPFIVAPTSSITSLYNDPSAYDSTGQTGQPKTTVSYNVSVDGGWFETPYRERGACRHVETYTAARIEWTIDQEELLFQGRISQVTECGLTPCLKRVQAETRNAKIYSTIEQKKLLASYYPLWIGNYLNDQHRYSCFRNFSDPPPDYDFGTGSSVQWDNGIYKYTFSDKQNRTFCIDSLTNWCAYNNPLDQVLLGNSSAWYISSSASGLGIVMQPFSISDPLPYGTGSSSTYQLLDEGHGLQSALHNITTAMDVAGLRDNNDVITGQVLENAHVIVVRWQWLTLPIVLELLTVVFLVVVMAQTKQRVVSLWKTSVLPFVLGGLESDSALELEDVSQPKTAGQMHHL